MTKKPNVTIQLNMAEAKQALKAINGLAMFCANQVAGPKDPVPGLVSLCSQLRRQTDQMTQQDLYDDTQDYIDSKVIETIDRITKLTWPDRITNAAKKRYPDFKWVDDEPGETVIELNPTYRKVFSGVGDGEHAYWWLRGLLTEEALAGRLVLDE